MISVVALMCHALTSGPLCHEVVVASLEDDNNAKQVCNLGQAALAEWKANSKFAGDDWYIGRFRCTPGKPVIRDET